MLHVLRMLFYIVIVFINACDSPESSQHVPGVSSVDPVKAYGKELIAWWKFDEGTGKIAKDTTMYQNTATIINGEWGDGVSGSALLMNGGNDSIVIVPLSDSLKSTADAITVTAWAYRTAQHNVDVVGHTYPYFFFGYHGPQFKFQLGSRSGVFAKCYAPKKYLAVLNEWQYLAGTYDGKMVRLYVNGVEICTAPLTGKIVMPDEDFTLSGYMNRNDEIVDEISGKIDEVRIYNYALDPDEINALMYASRSALANKQKDTP